VLILMNMQNKIHAIQFSHHLMNDSQSVPEQWSQNPKIMNFTKFQKKFKLPHQRGSELTETKRAESFPTPSQRPFLNWAQGLWYGIFPLPSWAICLAVLPPAPAHLLVSWMWETGKGPWFYSNNWKQCYQHSSPKSKT